MAEKIEDNFQKWQIKLKEAKQGSYQSIEIIRNHIFKLEQEQYWLQNYSFYELLNKAQIHSIKKGQVYANQFNIQKLPILLVFQGQLEIRYTDIDGENHLIHHIRNSGAINLKKDINLQKIPPQLSSKTKFNLFGIQETIFLEVQSSLSKPPQLSQKQKQVINNLLLFPNKQIIKMKINSNSKLTNKIYLLEGTAYYTQEKEKLILSCYNEGYFNPNQFEGKYQLVVCEGSQVLILDQTLMRDDIVKGLETKRQEHLNFLQSYYNKVDNNTKASIQEKIRKRYKIPIKKQKIANPWIQSKEKLIQTSSSMSKQKCLIRIKKTVKKKL